MKINIDQQKLRKSFSDKQRKGNWLIRPCGVSPFKSSLAYQERVTRSEYWPVLPPHRWHVFLAKLFPLREIDKQPTRLTNSENWKFTHGRNSGQRANIDKVAVLRKRPHGFAKGGNNLINGSLKLAANISPENSPFSANSSERMGDRKLADKCKPIRADFEFNEFLRGSPPKSEEHPFRLFQSKFTNRRS
ncbi:hypothetical protein ACYFX5_12835 [Bremerella sp. T1]|uniref:hypothetical protein n=1 Tax=Bremerella sp. TYQ1 TaxID=3119568 RepID=UPI001CCC1715|nr:hypothetical protein [Bremerella volcania]UBM33946.1 hypothetical protein LA756_14780 [Bremerella volcania]